jgi:hypothetical protein
LEIDENSKSLVGSWSAVITLMGDTFPGLFAFTRDGIVLQSDPPSSAELMSPGYGNWVPTGLSDAAFTFLYFSESVDNKLASTAKVKGVIHYDANKDSWEGTFKIDILDQNGNLVTTDPGKIIGTRIAVEMMD